MSERLSNALEFLSNHPLVGAASGFGSWGLLNVNFFTNPINLNIVTIFAAWCGAIICFLTVALKLNEAFEKIRSKFK